MFMHVITAGDCHAFILLAGNDVMEHENSQLQSSNFSELRTIDSQLLLHNYFELRTNNSSRGSPSSNFQIA